ncbi:hypothetical protein B0T21DRAFT_352453 [Apiosordaria backusii]|uniref:Uncharacterized protein n=1 Tax=Apiosordaria backusii TaxID=314023 RepID=A0AA40AAT1_9PEZI|nr:hypothetical protein B0T21DRAFT_352453 [Apiosordaria backusii]
MSTLEFDVGMSPEPWFIPYQASGLLATPAAVSLSNAARIKAECGPLGVMTYNETALPDFIDRNAIRKCVDHPSSTLQVESSSQKNPLQKRVCYYDKPYGCGRGNRCFQQCGVSGSGQWCWLAANHGMGDWVGCSLDEQCNSVNTDWGCGVGGQDCKACGCSCSGGDPPE